ncbi:diguanylate cyclase (GGDEF) domain-containing protein [Pseudobutyrivibrio sp. YE44]|uniref:bifunctional diguanylate cyclase/phosphodiesterase n=1 Tax=Pseudobutyrivibrio sp. YE44 TaxID=1520802 RepID=UPI000888705E|nr:GGDEF domain-containing protein [Pseudobutyrivibrio sp. YE44]SDB23132.1 diguanylate cyclase (GGDEF) domain-containing protein [Pseudobutyrivibrio sp. YE44]
MISKETTFDKSKYLIENFDRALEEGWIEVYYQPIIRSSNGRVCDEEALVRWDDPIMGCLNPMEFIPVLEAVNLVHKLDLYVLEQVLDKLQAQTEGGLYVVPNAINLSQIDFYACDIVDEVYKRVQASNIAPEMIAIGIAESAIGRNNEYVIGQLKEFARLGFKIWMDDYGCGDSAPLLMQAMDFDLVKINIGIINRLNEDSIKVVVTEMVRMAMAIGVDTVAEGVEDEAQVRFLKDVGCSKLQGFHYCKPVTREQIFARYREGKAIGFENPKETDYYSTVGKISLYDLSFARATDDSLDDYFDTLPMAIVEVNNEKLSFVRGNKQFRIFLEGNFFTNAVFETYYFEGHERSVGYYALNSVRHCAMEGGRKIVEDRTKDGKMVQLFIQKIAQNPETGMNAVAIVILSVTEQQPANDTLTYNYIARALSEDYITLFFVDLDTDEYVQYSPDGSNRDVTVERKGTDFFDISKNDAQKMLYRDDLELFNASFSKEAVIQQIKECGTYSLTYRIINDEKPTYVMLKAVKIRTGANKIIIGINNVDAQMKNKETMERIKEERITFSRISALSGDFLCIYAIDPNTDNYIKYKTSQEFEKLDLEDAGENFFETARKKSKDAVYAEDLEAYIKNFDKKTILERISNSGLFVLNYRLILNGMPKYVCMKAALVEELDGPRLIIGLLNVDKQVKKELEYAENLLAAEDRASRDELTGVKNKHAYVDAEIALNDLIKEGNPLAFAIVVFDLNGLKHVNDTMGHQAGDAYIKEGCSIICTAFAHSPVYRIGGDEFCAIVQGRDYANMDAIIDNINSINSINEKKGKVTIATGFSINENDRFVADVFQRADANMYKNKEKMKKHH